MDRGETIAGIYGELTRFTRRVRARGGAWHPDLSLVAYTLLAHIDGAGRVRAADLAAHYALDKSTVSRQVADLRERGLVTPVPDERDARAHVLTITPEGRRRLDEANASLRDRLEDRLSSWPEEDLATFAALLARFNADMS
ncbi:MarR family winged helix-turn-helix transcriptional regulator [Bailinhaonella thermotolerans]|uniref:MarR family transcriptional regulator n=1 Tax=Bailinhaonella thermotolerans TaxID=1070861 RepID=A0A3A4AKX7_9ACTN|nr:MarR family winged helix-turn-helix transcriptional regulator [Bailinhaonella thermotolerans]RJL21767.1 MarR family transcriptional regulator [Bailinhaonella thermotolerans]